jgi:hypothetical protein
MISSICHGFGGRFWTEQFRVVHLRGLDDESDCCTIAVTGDLAHKQKDIDMAMGGLTVDITSILMNGRI